jgi:hypothetical protein
MINICESGAKVINLNITFEEKVNGRLIYLAVRIWYLLTSLNNARLRTGGGVA